MGSATHLPVRRHNQQSLRLGSQDLLAQRSQQLRQVAMCLWLRDRQWPTTMAHKRYRHAHAAMCTLTQSSGWKAQLCCLV